MQILSHRGYWKTAEEKNGKKAFKRSFDLGFGTETDIRDHGSHLVISHDIPNGNEQLLDDFLESLPDCTLPLAINIKADGLAEKLKITFSKFNIQNWFVFDMSIPDMRMHLMANNPVFIRMSEVEKNPPWHTQAKGIWLDSFDQIWYDTNDIAKLTATKKTVCIVSEELHGRPYLEQWHLLKPLRKSKELMLCTDLPEQAKAFFDGA